MVISIYLYSALKVRVNTPAAHTKRKSQQDSLLLFLTLFGVTVFCSDGINAKQTNILNT